MDSMMETFNSLQRQIEASTKVSKVSSPSAVSAGQIPGQSLNDSVYELWKPPGRPSVELVFFHGLNWGGVDAHFRSWLSADGSQLWPLWILNEVPNARILLISYDRARSAEPAARDVSLDMYWTCENVINDLIDAEVGQSDRPVVLVGHSFGCLTMKQVCVTLASTLEQNLLPIASDINKGGQKLLGNVKGLFYYSSPVDGSEVLQYKWPGFTKGALFEEFTNLNRSMVRMNEYFRKHRQVYRWRTYGIQEGLPTIVVSNVPPRVGFSTDSWSS